MLHASANYDLPICMAHQVCGRKWLILLKVTIVVAKMTFLLSCTFGYTPLASFTNPKRSFTTIIFFFLVFFSLCPQHSHPLPCKECFYQGTISPPSSDWITLNNASIISRFGSVLIPFHTSRIQWLHQASPWACIHHHWQFTLWVKRYSWGSVPEGKVNMAKKKKKKTSLIHEPLSRRS